MIHLNFRRYFCVRIETFANKWFVDQYITGWRSVVSEYMYISHASRSWYTHFTTDLQPVVFWATNHYKQKSAS